MTLPASLVLACSARATDEARVDPDVRRQALEGEGPCVPALSQFPGQTLSVLPCEAVKVATPFAADFTGAGTFGITDADGRHIGFSMCLPSSNGAGYLAENLALDVASGELLVTTTAGIHAFGNDTQDNALGVGLALPNGMFRIETTLAALQAGSGQYEQAGLWFGISESDFIKLAVMSAPNAEVIHAALEAGDAQGVVVNLPIPLPIDEVRLVLLSGGCVA